MRGEHVLQLSVDAEQGGSSPHARGALVDADLALADRGIIPACAGSTLSLSLMVLVAWDHPRMRGEHMGST